MKKLNKLLMPVVGLSTIAATAIPLASCNKGYTDGVEVTKTEYQEAFAYLAACKEGSTWQTSSEDTFQAMSVAADGQLNHWTEYYDIAFNDDYGTAKAIGKGKGEVAFETQSITSIRKNNCYFTFSEELNSEEKTSSDVTVEPISEIQGMLVEIASYYYDYYNDGLTFDKDTKTYVYSGYGTVDNKFKFANSKVRFDSNKKITYINTHYGQIDQNDYETMLVDVVLHPKYDNVKIDVDQKYIDMVGTHTKEMTNNSLEVAKSGIMIKGMSDSAPLVVDIAPKTGGEKTLTVKCKEDTDWKSLGVSAVYKNGELLEEDGDKGYTHTNNVIEFKEALKTSDKIEVACSLRGLSDSNRKTFTFTLA